MNSTPRRRQKAEKAKKAFQTDFDAREAKPPQCRKITRNTFRLCKRTFSSRQRTNQEQNLLFLLRLRCWVIHIAYQVIKLGWWAMGVSVWLTENQKCRKD